MADLIYKTIQTQILLRSDTSTNWDSANPQLGIGEIAISTDLDQFKIGKKKANGELASWRELNYFEGNLKDAVTALGGDVADIKDVLEDRGSGESVVKGLKTRVSELEANKVDKDVYKNKIESLESEISQLTSGGLVREIVDELPAVGEVNVIYLVPSEYSADVYDEYMYIEAKGENQAHFELIGNTKVDLSGYATKENVEAIYKKDGETESGVLVDKIEDIIKENGTIDTKVAAEADLREQADTELSNRIDVIYKPATGEGENLVPESGLLVNVRNTAEANSAAIELLNEDAETEGSVAHAVATAKYIKSISISDEKDVVEVTEDGQTATIGLKDYAKVSDVEAIYKPAESEGAEAKGLLADAQKDIDALETRVGAVEGAIGNVDTKYIKTIEISEASNEVVISANGQTATIGLKDYAKDTDVEAVQNAVAAIYTPATGENESYVPEGGVLVTKVNAVKTIAEDNAGAIEVLNGNAETEGSVAHTVAAAVNAAKYITSVDESFVVSEGKLSLSGTTVFILNGGSASDR